MTLGETPRTPVHLRGCSKTFPDGTRALEPLDLEIAGGETVVFLGPSGCGKTTTLRLVAGLEAPDPGGRVLFDGQDVTPLPIEKRRVGMVFQSYALFPNMDVAGNVGYGLRVRRVSEAERQSRVAGVLEMMAIGDLAHRRIDQLSGGQRQRVALARALAVQPRVLLLDEPLTALDAALRERLRVEIDALLRRLGITAIYVTHDQSEAMALGDRIVVMSRGQVAQIGPPREIYFRPASRFVAEFIGTMNLLRGSRRGGWLQLPGGRVRLPASDETPDAAEADYLCRPEALLVTDSQDAVLSGRVASALFLGNRTRLIVEGLTERPVVAEAPGRREFRPGERVGFALDPQDVIRLPD
ncbi:ABC transporter ATP-binding protein [Algihabitans albus]|uniref:ABC transporter ATP-binding protein n=1 Tax=Algihabitans albus TaxID=2164067 RepID=UPI000E5D1BE5|nr:ABC transporter ATP-binding protein [Algihabitans albus]